jgi:hypothetical protein
MQMHISRFLNSFGKPLAFRAQTDKLQPMSGDLIIRPLSKHCLKIGHRLNGCILNLSATQAAHMIVVIRNTIETLLSSPQFELLNQAVLSEHLKIAIDRAETNPGQSPANEFIDLAGRRMSAVSLQLFQNHLALPGYS